MKEKLNVLLFCLRRLFILFFRDKGRKAQAGTSGEVKEETVQEEIAQEEPAFPNLATVICDRLEYLRLKRIFSICKRNKRMEWSVSPADFTDAYLFLLGIPSMEVSNMECHRTADYVSYRMAFPKSRTIELTDNTQRKSAQALLRLSEGNDCILRIYFIKPLKTTEL